MAIDVGAPRQRVPVNKDRIGVAVVGMGYWGPNLARNLNEIPDADLVAISDTNAEALAPPQRRYPGAHLTTRLDDVLSDESVDAVMLATPVSTHYALAAAALDAGKHVFVEKPLAASAAEAESLVETAAEAGLLLMPGHTFLYSPPVNLTKEMIRRGDLGDIYFISMSRVNLGLHQPDVSVAWDLGPHDFSILRYWLDETPRYVSAISRGCIIPETPDVAFINLEFASGAIAHVELSWLAPSKLRRTTIVGSEKMVVYDDTSNEPVRLYDSGVTLRRPENFGEYRLTYRTGDILTPHLDTVEPLFLELSDFVRAIRTGTDVRSNAQIGLDVVRTIEAVERSLNEDGIRVDVEAVFDRL